MYKEIFTNMISIDNDFHFWFVRYVEKEHLTWMLILLLIEPNSSFCRLISNYVHQFAINEGQGLN